MNLFRSQNKMENKLRQKFADFETKPSESLWNRIADNIPSDSFEFELKEKLDPFATKPSGKVWNEIESELESNAARENNLWKYSSILSLLVISIFAYFLISREMLRRNEHTIQSSKSFNDSTSRLKTEPTQPKKSKLAANEEKKTVNTYPLSFSKKQPTNSSNNITSIDLNDEKNSQSLKSTGRNNKLNTTNDGEISSRNNFIEANNTTHATYNKSKISSQTHQTHHSEPIKLAKENVPANVDNSTVSKDELQVNNPQQPDSDKQLLSISTPDSTLKHTQLDTQKDHKKQTINDDSIVNTQVNLPLDSNCKSSNSTSQNNNDEDISKISITVHAGMNYSMMQLKAPIQSQISFAENIDMRNQVEKPEMDFSAAFHINYHLTDHITLSSGVGLINFNQIFYYNISAPTSIKNASEPGAKMIHSTDSILTGNAYSTTIRYTWTEIPILISYETLHHNKWKLFFQTGLSYALLRTVNAGIINYDNIGILVLSDKQSFPTLQNSVFVHVNGGVYYQLNKTIEIGAMPTFKYSLNSMVNNKNWVQQYPYMAGLAFNIRKRF